MYSDFIVKFDPTTENDADILRKVFKSLFVNRLKIRKPVIVFIGGDSGEAKSSTAVKLMQILCELQNINIRDYMKKDDDVMNCYIPIQYPQKLHKILYEKEYKKVNCIAIHESRDVIKAKMWHSFVATAIADVNAQVRQVKPLAIFIISQFIRDITTDIRYTLTYYITCYRHMSGGHAAIRIYRMWKDDRDLENPKLRKRLVRGIVKYPNGTKRVYVPKMIYFKKPDRDLQEILDHNDLEAKKKIIQGRLERLMKEMQLELDIGNPKLDAMVKYYSDNPESLRLIGKKHYNKWKLLPEVVQMHDLTKEEFKEFQKMLDVELQRKQIQLSKVSEFADDTGENDGSEKL